jgi:hypothetical protein
MHYRPGPEEPDRASFEAHSPFDDYMTKLHKLYGPFAPVRALRAYAIAAVLSISGCATLMNIPTQQINIRTVPAGAECEVGSLLVASPAVVQLRRDRAHEVTCRKPGYRTATAAIHRRWSDWIIADLLFPPWFLVDDMSGSNGNLYPAIVTMNLESE